VDDFPNATLTVWKY